MPRGLERASVVARIRAVCYRGPRETLCPSAVPCRPAGLHRSSAFPVPLRPCPTPPLASTRYLRRRSRSSQDSIPHRLEPRLSTPVERPDQSRPASRSQSCLWRLRPDRFATCLCPLHFRPTYDGPRPSPVRRDRTAPASFWYHHRKRAWLLQAPRTSLHVRPRRWPRLTHTQ